MLLAEQSALPTLLPSHIHRGLQQGYLQPIRDGQQGLGGEARGAGGGSQHMQPGTVGVCCHASGACLPARPLPACLHARTPACTPARLLARLPACLPNRCACALLCPTPPHPTHPLLLLAPPVFRRGEHGLPGPHPQQVGAQRRNVLPARWGRAWGAAVARRCCRQLATLPLADCPCSQLELVLLLITQRAPLHPTPPHPTPPHPTPPHPTPPHPTPPHPTPPHPTPPHPTPPHPTPPHPTPPPFHPPPHPPHPTPPHTHTRTHTGLHKDPPEFDMKWAREEAELVMFNAVKDLLAKTRLAPRDIDVLGGWVGGRAGGGGAAHGWLKSGCTAGVAERLVCLRLPLPTQSQPCHPPAPSRRPPPPPPAHSGQLLPVQPHALAVWCVEQLGSLPGRCKAGGRGTTLGHVWVRAVANRYGRACVRHHHLPLRSPSPLQP